MANLNPTPGQKVAWNRFALILWVDNEPWFEIYRVQPNLAADPTEPSGVKFTGKFIRESKTSWPVDEEAYAEFGAEFLNSLPMIDAADYPHFYSQEFELEKPLHPDDRW